MVTSPLSDTAMAGNRCAVSHSSQVSRNAPSVGAGVIPAAANAWETRTPSTLPPSAPQSRFSRPIVGERSSEPTLRMARRTPGMKDSRSIESCRIVSVWPSPPKMTSWCATKPGSRTEWIGSGAVPPAGGVRSAGGAARGADQLGGARCRARRGVELLVVVELDDLALRHVLRDELRRLHHQHG